MALRLLKHILKANGGENRKENKRTKKNEKRNISKKPIFITFIPVIAIRVARRGVRMTVRDVVLRLMIAWSCLIQEALSVSRPNIVIILADDLGWNDVSFHGSNQIQTPNIDALAYNGIILNSHYVPALCTPSRASLLTGKYPTSLGMQHLVILAQEPWGLPLEEALMSQHLKRHGYATHAIGKWHLGFHEKEYTPIYRGFDSHFGYWNGFQDYYDHTMQSETLKGYDMRRGLSVDHSSKGVYSTDAFTDEAIDIINNHNSTQGPLFLYLAHLAPHAGNPDQPFQAPEEEVAKHSHITDLERRIYAAMVSRVDDSLGRVMSALRDKNMLDNSIVLFMSDNGAVTFGMHSNRGSNYPLRGLKESPWEGGVRGVAAIWSPLLNQTQRVSNQLMHMADWLPTLYSAAGLDISELGTIDGMNMWDVLSHNLESPRREVFNNYDEIEDYSSLRVASWKYIAGTAQAGEVDLWYGESGKDCQLEYNISKVFDSPTNQAVSWYLKEKSLEKVERIQSSISQETVLILRKNSVITCDYPAFSSLFLITDNHNETVDQNDEFVDFVSRSSNGIAGSKKRILEELRSYLSYPLKGTSFPTLDEAYVGSLIESGELRNAFKCDPLKMVCLFNLEKDPCERVNLARIFPFIVQTLETRLKELKKSVVRPLNQPDDPFSNPAFHNGTWTNWCDVRKERNSRVFFKVMMGSATSALYLDHLFLILSKNVFAIFPDYLQETVFLFFQLLERFFWLVTLLVSAVMVLYAVASLRRVVEPQSEPFRKKSWVKWENLTYRSITNPSNHICDMGRER